MEPDRAIRATYHDPCYLGRYNGEFEAPRRLIAASGYQLVEMGRSRENSFCCGAGGGRIWAGDEGVLERPSENRIKEALALGDISVFVVACPKDKVMYSAAVDALGAKELDFVFWTSSSLLVRLRKAGTSCRPRSRTLLQNDDFR